MSAQNNPGLTKPGFLKGLGWAFQCLAQAALGLMLVLGLTLPFLPDTDFSHGSIRKVGPPAKTRPLARYTGPLLEVKEPTCPTDIRALGSNSVWCEWGLPGQAWGSQKRESRTETRPV